MNTSATAILVPNSNFIHPALFAISTRHTSKCYRLIMYIQFQRFPALGYIQSESWLHVWFVLVSSNSGLQTTLKVGSLSLFIKESPKQRSIIKKTNEPTILIV